jgi:ABC-type multidrug transport system fused ATPase/permease subunit
VNKTRFRKLLYLLNSYEKKKLLLLLFLAILGSVLDIATIGIIPAMITIVSDQAKMDMLNAKLGYFGYHINDLRSLLIYGSVLVILVYILKNSFFAFLIYLRAKIIADMQERLCFSLLVKYYNAPYEFHLTRNSSDLLAKVYDEARQVVNNLIMPGLTLIMEVITAVTILIFLVSLQPVITFITALVFISIGAIYLFTIKKQSDFYGSRLPYLRSDLLKATQEGIHGLKDARVLNREQYFLKRIYGFLNGTTTAQKFQNFTSQITKPFVETTGITLVMCIIIYLAFTETNTQSIIPVISLFGIAALRLLPSINQIVSNYSAIRITGFTADIVYDEFKALENESSIARTEKSNSGKLLLQDKIDIKSIQFSYKGTNKNVLEKLSISIKRGEAVAFVGPSGSGKTTLVDLILGLLSPKEGSIYVDGQDIFQNIQAWRDNIGYVPQFIYLTDDTIKRNIAFGIAQEEINEDALWSAIRAAQLETLINDLPEGLNTEIGERGVRLSGGQRQRIGIARALYHNPEVLIFDEATSALDNLTEKYITEEINLLKGSRTIILVAHRLTTVQNCDCIYFIKNGRLADSGRYEHLLENNPEFRQMALANNS